MQTESSLLSCIILIVAYSVISLVCSGSVRMSTTITSIPSIFSRSPWFRPHTNNIQRLEDSHVTLIMRRVFALDIAAPDTSTVLKKATMAQKRSKNQIRRERVKLRKLGKLSEKSAVSAGENTDEKTANLGKLATDSTSVHSTEDNSDIKVDEGDQRENGPNKKEQKCVMNSREGDLGNNSVPGTKEEATSLKEHNDKDRDHKDRDHKDHDHKAQSNKNPALTPKRSSPSLDKSTDSTSVVMDTTSSAQPAALKVSEAKDTEGDSSEFTEVTEAEIKAEKASVDDANKSRNDAIGRSDDKNSEGSSKITHTENKDQEIEKDPGTDTEQEAPSKKEQILGIFSKAEQKKEEKKEEPETLLSQPEEAQDLLSQFSSIFHRFEPKETTETKQIANYTGGQYSSSNTSSSEESDSDENTNKQLSKRQKRLREKIPISVLKSSAANPQAVEWYDADAPDPYMVVHLKSRLNHVNVPPHWQHKKEYLSAKRGVEKSPFVLPKFIENTGIAEMRNHDPESLKKLQRDRVQPKMGRLDIDYQKLHDAFFKHQTKPKLLAFGEVYSEGREKADQYRDNVAKLRPGKISKALRLAVGMSDNEKVAPPWITVMKDLGKPPSYVNLIIPGIDTEYTNRGYLIQYGEKASGLDLLLETWGSLEEGEESEVEESEQESEAEEKPLEAARLVEEAAEMNPALMDEDEPAKVEIAEFSKFKSTSSPANIASTLGSLYKVLKEQSTEPTEASGGGKYRYDLGSSGDKESGVKTLDPLKQAPVDDDDDDDDDDGDDDDAENFKF